MIQQFKTTYSETLVETANIIIVGILMFWVIGIVFGPLLHLLGDPTALVEVTLFGPLRATLIAVPAWLAVSAIAAAESTLTADSGRST